MSQKFFVRLFHFLFALLVSVPVYSQTESGISGRVTDVSGKGISLANVLIQGTNAGTVTDPSGYYRLPVPVQGNITLIFSCLGYISVSDSLDVTPGKAYKLDKQLETDLKKIEEVLVSGQTESSSNLTVIDLKVIGQLPNTSGNIETILKTLPGVSSNNELSSQYSVRGGNYDENLVYVNDIEIYRPFLIRSGQQEGLSFINPDLVAGIRFSAGGFDATYGDKMSSVLDITYKRPSAFGGSVSASLLGGSVHMESAGRGGRFSQITGIRYKSNQYLLNTLDTKGEYKPSFGDIQTYMNYRLSGSLDISFLGNFARNQYTFIPVSRETDFGTIKNSFRLKIYYDGNELDRYDTWLGALSLHYHPNERLSLKLTGSGYQSSENESFDIQGQYLINLLDTRIGSETAGDSIANIGVGSFLDHARNFLDVEVATLSHTGSYFGEGRRFRWGIKYQGEFIHDALNEWKMIDSAGYSLPYSPTSVELLEVIKSENRMETGKLTAFFQSGFSFELFGKEMELSAGIRSNYWDYNKQLLINPRIALAMEADEAGKLRLRFAAGKYDQPAFYKELRDPSGTLNNSIRAQESVHLVLGSDYYFTAWQRPFKFTSEFYYKSYTSLIPYKIDNVRVRYAAVNNASGYATGIDLKIHGEFVKDAESWASLSLMRTREDIHNDSYLNEDTIEVFPGYYPRPSDQLLNFGLYFQDYMPSNPSYRVSLYLLFGSRLPFSAPMSERYDLVYRMPAYKRVDIGFIKVIKEEGVKEPEGRVFRPFRSVLLSAEIFNLFANQNTISYLWVKTVSNQEGIPGLFAVPNYLTSRRFNIRLTFKF